MKSNWLELATCHYRNPDIKKPNFSRDYLFWWWLTHLPEKDYHRAQRIIKTFYGLHIRGCQTEPNAFNRFFVLE